MDQQSTELGDLLFEVRNGIGRVTFNRPQARNAFTFEMYERLAQICEQADKYVDQGACSSGSRRQGFRVRHGHQSISRFQNA